MNRPRETCGMADGRSSLHRLWCSVRQALTLASSAPWGPLEVGAVTGVRGTPDECVNASAASRDQSTNTATLPSTRTGKANMARRRGMPECGVHSHATNASQMV